MRMSYDNTNTVEFTACNSVQKSKMNVTTIVERNVNGVTGSLSIWLHRRRWLPRGCYPQTAMLFPLHFPRLFSAGGMRLPHTAMLLLLHFDRIALLAALSSQDMSLFLPHDASRPIRLSSPPPPSSGSPSSPYASPGSWNSELRRVLCERAGGRSAAAEEAGAPSDHRGLVATSTKATVATTTIVDMMCWFNTLCRFVIIRRPRAQIHLNTVWNICTSNHAQCSHFEAIFKW